MLGLICQNSKRVEEAEELYIKAMKLDPTDPHVCNNLGIIFKTSNRIKEA